MRRRSSLAQWHPRWLGLPGIHVSQLFRWRQQLCGAARAAPVFSPVMVAPGPGATRCHAADDAGRNRDRICDRGADAAHGAGRRFDGQSDGHGAGEGQAAMIPVPSGVQVWLATGHTDMRKGFDGLAVLVQETLKRNPHNGHLFVFRGRRGGLIKVLVARRPGPVPVREAAGTRPLRVAICRSPRRRGREGGDHAGAAGISARRDRLASAATDVASTSGRVDARLID